MLRPEARGAPGWPGKLLSWGRFAYIARHRGCFETTVLAEMRAAIDAHGRSAFWDAFGRRFTGMSYTEADHRSASDKSFMLDLFPDTPFYASLLDAEVAARARPRARRGDARAAPARAGGAALDRRDRPVRRRAVRRRADRARRCRCRRPCAARWPTDAPPEGAPAGDRLERGRRRLPRGRGAAPSRDGGRRSACRQGSARPARALERRRGGVDAAAGVGARRRAAMAEPSRFAAARRLRSTAASRCPSASTARSSLEDPGDTRAPLGAFPFAASAVERAIDAARARLARLARRARPTRAPPLCVASAKRCARTPSGSRA